MSSQLLTCRAGIAPSPSRLVTKHLQAPGMDKTRDFCKQAVVLCYTENAGLFFSCVMPLRALRHLLWNVLGLQPEVLL